MAVKRGVMFELQTSLSPDVDKAFTAMEKRIDALQGKMRVAFSGNFNGGGNGYSNGNGNGNGTASAGGRRGGANRITGFAGGAGSGVGPFEDSKQVDKAIADIQRLQRAADAAQRKDDERARKAAMRDALSEGRRRGKLEKTVVDKEEKYQASRQRDREREAVQEAAAGRRHAQEREREQARAARQSEIVAAKQREGQHRLGESIGNTTDALTRLGEGFSYLGLIGQRDLGQLSDSLLRIKGTVESIRGISGLLRGTGGGGGIGRLLGGAGRLGMGALGGTGGLLAGGSAAAIALLANMGTGGRFTNAGGRFIAHQGIGISQRLHSLGNIAETFGMGEAERGQVNYRRATQMEDVNNPSGFGLGVLMSAPGAAMTGNYNYRNGLGHDIDAAAAAARNTARLQALNNQRAQQRHTFQRLANAEMGGELSISGMQRERENAQADIDRETKMAYFRQNSSGYFLGSTRGKGATKLNYRTTGHTGIGATAESLGLDYAPESFAPGGFFSSARGIHDRGERMRFLQERRDKNAGYAGEQSRIKQRLQSLSADRDRTQTEQAKLQMARDLGTGYNPEGEQRAAEALKQIDEERARLTRESDQLHRQMREQDIQDAAKLLEFAKQNAETAKSKVSSAVKGVQGVQEQIGAMNPMQIANLVQARKRAEAGEELSLDQMNVLANGPDERSRFLGRQALQQRGRKQLEAVGGEGLIGNVEDRMFGSAQAQAETAYEKLGQGEKELKGVTNQVVVGGDYHVTIDIRDDMQLAETMHEHQASIEQQFREHDQKIISAVRAMISESMKNVHEQGKVGAGG